MPDILTVLKERLQQKTQQRDDAAAEALRLRQQADAYQRASFELNGECNATLQIIAMMEQPDAETP